MSKASSRKEIRITRQDVVRKILEEQRAGGDKNPATTLATIIDRYRESRRTPLGNNLDVIAH
jgi:hypothetical protein